METHYGFKKLTIDNLLEPDTWGALCDSNDNLSSHVSIFLEPQLKECVPQETRSLFEVARGTMVYGVYFYPLYTIGMEQLFRVCENALKQRIIVSGIELKTRKRSFHSMLKKLIEEQILTSEQEKRWDSCRRLRNMSSHPDHQSIVSPAMAINVLDSIADQINMLFVPNPNSE